jgi:DNA polymerase I-like protein with 3'-5' exonuclease and polymerase domains
VSRIFYEYTGNEFKLKIIKKIGYLLMQAFDLSENALFMKKGEETRECVL